MSQNRDGVIHSATDAGTVAEHGYRREQLILVSPTLSNTFNTIGLDLEPLGCVSLHDGTFGFDSSVITREAGKLIGSLPRLRESRRVAGELPLVSIFGHADPVGSSDYNKNLSGRRAAAVYGLLTHDPEHWEKLFNEPLGGDNWREKNVVEQMREQLGAPSNTPRTRVFSEYMDTICNFRLERSDFLGRGSDSGGKADYQGCGEYNPLVVLSQEENEGLPEESRNRLNHLNRRVVIYLFSPLVPVSASAWPCPRATESGEGCKKRFFPDHAERLTASPERKEFAVVRNTFGCRFYDRIARHSVCETFGSTPMRIWVRLDIDPKDPAHTQDEFVLRDAAGAYRSVKTIKDDRQEGDSTIDLLFEGVRRGPRYTLEVHPGKNRPVYTIFENLTYDDIQAFGG